MRIKRVSKFAFFLLFVLVFLVFFTNTAKVDHGFGILEYIRNKTTFPLSVRSKIGITYPGSENSPGFVTPKKGIIFPGESAKLEMNPLIANADIVVRGFVQEKIKDFKKGEILTLEPLYNKGVAWLDYYLKSNNKALISFWARAGDDGGITLVFGNNFSPKFCWKVIIGAESNSETIIIKYNQKTGKENVVYRLSGKNNPLAVVRPGVFEQYWVMISGNSILMGKGDILMNPIFFWKDYSNVVIRTVGFSSNKSKVDYINIAVGDLTAGLNEEWNCFYRQDGNLKKIKHKENISILDNVLRIPERGTFSVEARGNSGIILGLGENREYEVVVGDELNSRCVIKRKGEIVAIIPGVYNKEAVITNPKLFLRYWMSFKNGLIMFGRGAPGNNLLAIWVDPHPLKINGKIFVGSEETSVGYTVKSSVEFRNIMLGEEVFFDLKLPEDFYVSKKNFFEMPSDINIFSPVAYKLFQDGQMIGVRDLISGTVYHLQKAPQQGARYFFIFSVLKNGEPKLDWTHGPEESPLRYHIRKRAHVSQASSEALLQATQAVAFAGSPGIGGVIASIAAGVFGVAGVIAATVAAEAKFDAENAFRSHDAYVFMEKVLKEKAVKGEALDRYKKDREKIKKKLNNMVEEKDSLKKIVILQDIIDRIDNYYVFSDDYIKNKVFDEIEKVFVVRVRYKKNVEYFKSLFTLLVSAYDNAFLISALKSSENKKRDQWYIWANEMFQDLFRKYNKSSDGVLIPPCYGEYFWVPRIFKTPNKGAVIFDAKGLNDIMICFANKPFKVRNTTAQIYEFDIGAWENTKTVLRIISLGKAVTFYNSEEHPEGMANEMDFRRYWIKINNNKISMGIGEVGESVLLEWTDPYPVSNIRFVGLSSWNSLVNIKNLKLISF